MSSLYGKSAGALVTVSLSSNAATIGNKIQTASMSFNTDGTCSLTSLVDGSTSWWNQVQAGIGSSYWVKIVYNSQINTVSSGATFGTWYHLSSAVTYTIKNSASTTEASGSASIYFSTAGTDATIVGATGSWSWDLGSAH
jgi:hypothetical protein